jgi:CubicO group peptidase (beta-lactamase class C family)
MSISNTLEIIERALEAWGLPGLVVGVTDRQQLLGVAVHGYADLKARTALSKDSRFAIGSISKSFTGLALLQLAAEGRLDLHAPITRYLPDVAVQSPFAPISAHHWLTHTSGLPNYLTHAASSRYAMEALRKVAPAYTPGAHWAYSNTGYQVLGYLLEELDGVLYPSSIQRRILDPLGMASTSAVIDDAERARTVTSYTEWPADGRYVEAPWFEYAAGDGSLISTVPDMCAYARCILNRGMGPKGRLLTEKDFATWTTPVLDGYAYGLMVRTKNDCTLLGHGGAIAGFHSSLEVNMKEGFGVVMLSSSIIPADLWKWIDDTVQGAIRGTPLAAAPAKRAPAELDQYAGVYHSAAPYEGGPGCSLECAVQEGHLWLKLGSECKRLERMGGDCFRVVGPHSDGLPFFFGRAEGEGVTQVTDVSQGSRWYVREGSAVQAATVPSQDYSAYVGHFENNGPEGPVLRFFVRNGRLFGAGLRHEAAIPFALEPVGTATFRVGQHDYSPERIHFDTFMGARAMRLTFSGVPMYRKDTC